MSKRAIDFLSSVGIMIFGVGLLFFCSVTLTAKPAQSFAANIPLVANEPLFQSGGGDDVLPPPLPVSRPRVPLLKPGKEFDKPLTAASAVVVDDETNAVLFKKNPTEVRSLASITKLMSTLVLSEMPLSMESSTVVSEDDYDPYSHHIDVGQAYTLDELWKLALIGSSNSAIRTLVRASSSTEAEFADKMNQKAKALGLNTLRFVEPTGLDSRNMGTAPDVLRLLKFALKENRISETLHMPEYYVKGKKKQHVWSTNWLLTNWVPNKFDKDVLVGKTGFIDQSGYNFVARIPGPKNHVVRVVVLGAATNEARFSEARDLAEWAFENYSWPEDEDYGKFTSEAK